MNRAGVGVFSGTAGAGLVKKRVEVMIWAGSVEMEVPNEMQVEKGMSRPKSSRNEPRCALELAVRGKPLWAALEFVGVVRTVGGLYLSPRKPPFAVSARCS